MSEALPAAQVAEREGTYLARLSYAHEMPVEMFLDAAFGGRFRFGIPSHGAAVVQIRVGEVECWNRNCGAKAKIVTGIDVNFGPRTFTFSVPRLGEYPALFDAIFGRVPRIPNLGKLKRRYSKTQEREYMSNGCYRCDGLFGEFFEIDALHSDEVVCSFPVRIDADWKRAIEDQVEYEAAWAVYSPGELEE